HTWFLETSGARALINHVDMRLGIEAHHANKINNSDLILGGFRRYSGRLSPIYLSRVYEDDVPVGYRTLTGLAILSPDYQARYAMLPSHFTYGQAKSTLEMPSDSGLAKFLETCVQAEVLKKESGKT